MKYRKRKSGFLALVLLMFSAFRARSGAGRAGCAVLLLQVVMGLLVYDKRVGAGGDAVCLLRPRPERVCTAGCLFFLICVALAWLGRPLGLCVPALGVLVLLLANGRSLREVPAKVRASRAVPRGRRVVVRSLASGRAGAGAELLRAVVREADDKGWVLVLDAATHALVPYYEGFGFAPAGSPDQASRQVRLCRRPRCRGSRGSSAALEERGAKCVA